MSKPAFFIGRRDCNLHSVFIFVAFYASWIDTKILTHRPLKYIMSKYFPFVYFGPLSPRGKKVVVHFSPKP